MQVLFGFFNVHRTAAAAAAAAAPAAKTLQSCPTLCDHIDGSPPGYTVPEILQARTLEWVAISFSNAWKWKVKAKSLNCVWLLETPWTAAYSYSNIIWSCKITDQVTSIVMISTGSDTYGISLTTLVITVSPEGHTDGSHKWGRFRQQEITDFINFFNGPQRTKFTKIKRAN